MLQRNANRGFTLVEILVTMSVAAVLIGAAVPAFSTFIQNNRDSTQINSLVLSMNYARSEAVKRNRNTGIIVCPSTDAISCSGTANWSGGWIVWDQDATHLPIQTVPGLAGTNTLSAVGASTGITFRSSGLVSAPIAVTICDTRGAGYARYMEVNTTGRIASSATAGKNLAGVNLTCP